MREISQPGYANYRRFHCLNSIQNRVEKMAQISLRHFEVVLNRLEMEQKRNKFSRIQSTLN